jgi:hypothetical protein
VTKEVSNVMRKASQHDIHYLKCARPRLLFYGSVVDIQESGADGTASHAESVSANGGTKYRCDLFLSCVWVHVGEWAVADAGFV